MNNKTEEWWDHTAEWYQNEADIPIKIHYGPGSPFEDELNLLGDVSGKEVIELGCGGGQCSIAFAKQGANVTAIDISNEQLSFARKLSRKHDVHIDFHKNNVTDIPDVEDNSKDIAFSAFVYEWVQNWEAAFEEAYRILKPSGVFVFSVPHPFFRIIDSETLEIEKSYFNTQPTKKEHEKGTMVTYRKKMQDIVNPLLGTGFQLERIIEPDPKDTDEKDPWYGLWEYQPEIMRQLPPTIIFKATK